MNDLILLYFILLVFFGGFYFVIIATFSIGWFSLRQFRKTAPEPKTLVSVLVPARNEENIIEKLLSNLCLQNYPNHLYEIIVIDDHSTDNTVRTVNNFISQHKARLSNPDGNGTTGQGFSIKLLRIKGETQTKAYKKKAIRTAIEQSSGNLIITTDADCLPDKNWIKTIVSLYETKQPKMIVGPVSFHREKTFFQKIQSLEFLSLIAMTAGAIKTGHPIMCNGANLAYEKQAFFDVGGFGIDRFSSGDDVFLLQRIRKLFGSNSVWFLKSKDAFVYTEALDTLREFFDQRIRWASKNKGYDLKILVISFTVYMMNLLLLAAVAISLSFPGFWKTTAYIFAVKYIIDLPVLIGIVSFAKKMKLFVYSVPLIVIYPIYIILAGALGIVSSYNWKGRKLKI
ncbi:MAG: glycosyltransferase [Chlorobi bacterium]|nr:glycosyltransferase [Chlorobiota bacterium]